MDTRRRWSSGSAEVDSDGPADVAADADVDGSLNGGDTDENGVAAVSSSPPGPSSVVPAERRVSAFNRLGQLIIAHGSLRARLNLATKITRLALERLAASMPESMLLAPPDPLPPGTVQQRKAAARAPAAADAAGARGSDASGASPSLDDNTDRTNTQSTAAGLVGSKPAEPAQDSPAAEYARLTAELLEELRDPDEGLAVADRHRGVRHYPACFLGSELVEWLVRRGWAADRKEAVTLGRMLQGDGIVYDVAKSGPFADGPSFYRLRSAVAPTTADRAIWLFGDLVKRFSVALSADLASKLEGAGSSYQRAQALQELRQNVLFMSHPRQARGWRLVASPLHGVQTYVMDREFLWSERGIRYPSRVTRTVGEVPVSPRHFVLEFLDAQLRHRWDPLLRDVRVVANLGPYTRILHRTSSSPLQSVGPRDACVMEDQFSATGRDGSATYVVYEISAVHRSAPEVPGMVRAEVLLAARVLRPVRGCPDRAQLTLISQVDFLGDAPEWLIDQWIGQQTVDGFGQILSSRATSRAGSTAGDSSIEDYSHGPFSGVLLDRSMDAAGEAAGRASVAAATAAAAVLSRRTEAFHAAAVAAAVAASAAAAGTAGVSGGATAPGTTSAATTANWSAFGGSPAATTAAAAATTTTTTTTATATTVGTAVGVGMGMGVGGVGASGTAGGRGRPGTPGAAGGVGSVRVTLPISPRSSMSVSSTTSSRRTTSSATVSGVGVTGRAVADAGKKYAGVGLQDFQRLVVLGRGAHSKIVQVRHRATGRLYAMKEMRKRDVIRTGQARNVMAERTILTRLRHPFLIRLYWSFQTLEKLYLVMDFAGGGDLFTYLQRNGSLPENFARVCAAEVVLAMRALHEQGVAHRDLKPENVLIGSDGHVVLADLGLAKDHLGPRARTYTMVGTAEYVAPEVVLGLGHGHEVDWWQLGVVLHEMLTGCHPFFAPSAPQMHQKIAHEPPQLDPELSPEASSLIRALLHKDPLRRLGGNPADRDIERHPFFRGLNWQAVLEKRVGPPFNPMMAGPDDTVNFDREFTCEPVISPADAALVSPSGAGGLVLASPPRGVAPRGGDAAGAVSPSARRGFGAPAGGGLAAGVGIAMTNPAAAAHAAGGPFGGFSFAKPPTFPH